MKRTFIRPLGYEYLFTEPKPKSLNHFFEFIPSDILIGYLSMINALIYCRKPTHEIINFIIPTVDVRERFNLIKRIYTLLQIDPKDEISLFLFRPEIVLRLISHELTHFRDFEFKSLSPGDDLKIFKAYIWAMDELSDEMQKTLPTDISELLDFPKSMWPSLVKQYTFNVRPGELYIDYKIRLFFELLDTHLSKYSSQYLHNKGYQSLERFLSDYLNLLWMKVNEAKKQIDPTFEIHLSKPNSLFDSLTIDINQITSNKDHIEDFIPIKEKPLYLNKRSNYNILSWDFLNNIFDIAFIFDFYKYSGIDEIYPTFLDFKGFYGHAFMEKVYFKRIIDTIFTKKHYIKIFDDGTKSGLPDCYIRDGNTIYIFECKDTLMPTNAFISNNYTDIISDINNKFIKNSRGKKKGLSQLIDIIEKISCDELIIEDYKNLGLNKSKLKIVPIIIYTHTIYRMHGINNYLNKYFQSEISKKERKNKYIETYPLTIISFDFVVGSIFYFKNDPSNLKELIKKYWNKVNEGEKKFFKLNKSNMTPNDIVNAQVHFNRSVEDMYKAEIDLWGNKNITTKKLFEMVNTILKINIQNEKNL